MGLASMPFSDMAPIKLGVAQCGNCYPYLVADVEMRNLCLGHGYLGVHVVDVSQLQNRLTWKYIRAKVGFFLRLSLR